MTMPVWLLTRFCLALIHERVPAPNRKVPRKTLALDEAAAQASRLRARRVDAAPRRARLRLRRARARERGGQRTRRAPRLGREARRARAARRRLRRVGLPPPRARRILSE